MSAQQNVFILPCTTGEKGRRLFSSNNLSIGPISTCAKVAWPTISGSLYTHVATSPEETERGNFSSPSTIANLPARCAQDGFLINISLSGHWSISFSRSIPLQSSGSSLDLTPA